MSYEYEDTGLEFNSHAEYQDHLANTNNVNDILIEQEKDRIIDKYLLDGFFIPQELYSSYSQELIEESIREGLTSIPLEMLEDIDILGL